MLSLTFFFLVIMDKYQEQPHLLDPHLGKNRSWGFDHLQIITKALEYVCVRVCTCTSWDYQDKLPRLFLLVGPTVVTPPPGSELGKEEGSDSNLRWGKHGVVVRVTSPGAGPPGFISQLCCWAALCLSFLTCDVASSVLPARWAVEISGHQRGTNS